MKRLTRLSKSRRLWLAMAAHALAPPLGMAAGLGLGALLVGTARNRGALAALLALGRSG